jgi:hypothetical protein
MKNNLIQENILAVILTQFSVFVSEGKLENKIWYYFNERQYIYLR